MLSLAHEIAVARLTEDPSLLPHLAEKLLGRPFRGRRRPAPTVIQLANPEEIRPDVLLAEGARGPWDAIEVQRRIDRVKMRRWTILVSVLHGQRGVMGDLWVLTSSPSVARWAARGCDHRGPRGTVLRVVPVVLLLGPQHIQTLLDRACPELAFFAAWAVAGRQGPEALETVEQALQLTRMLPTDLRRKQGRDILQVLNGRLVASLKERWRMDATRTRETRALREWRMELEAVGEARGKQQALLAVLAARGLTPDAVVQEKIHACADLALLDRWITGAVTAATVEQALGAPVRGRRVLRSSAVAPAPRRAKQR